MTNFYYAYYKKQALNKEDEWQEELYGNQLIVVIANNYDEAEFKILSCLDKIRNNKFAAILSSSIKEADGLNIFDFMNNLFVSPIEEN